jgi:hypothetical protein
MESVGFKEWSLVCDALGRGEQSIILRKGGIAEGRDGFSFRHREFFLFPTFFHEQLGKVRTRLLSRPLTNGTHIEISLYAKVESAVRIDSLQAAEALSPLHVLAPGAVRERFDYNGAGLNAAFVRVFRLHPTWIFLNEKRFGGCRSWVQLPELPPLVIRPVMNDESHGQRVAEFEKIISSTRA